MNNNPGLLSIIIALVTILVGWLTGFIKWEYQKLFHKSNGSDISVINKYKQKSGSNSQNIQGSNITINNNKDGN